MTINLAKNQTINLSKASNSLSQIRFGINWGMKESRGLFGFGKSKTAVDLDASATVFQGARVDTVSFMRLNNAFITHSGDDTVGDGERDDDDNETITINLSDAPNGDSEIYLYVNSYSGDKFDDIPYAGVRIYEGDVNKPEKVIAKFDLVRDNTFKGAKTVVLGKLFKEANGDWDFQAIGDAYDVSRIEPTIQIINSKYR